jgi:ABC-type amino acid transport substrate-binding protein
MRISISLTLLAVLFLLPFQSFAGAGTLERIKATKTLTIAYSPSSFPISYRDEQGEAAGYSVDLCHKIAAGIRTRLGLDELKVVWKEGNTPRRLAAIANGEADLDCGTTTMNLARQRNVDFSNIVFVESGGILVFADAGIEDLSDLAGKKIGVTPQTTTEKRLRERLEERLIAAELVPVRDSSDGREQLLEKKIDALAGDRLVLIGQVAEAGEPERFAILDEEYSIDPYAFAMPRNQAEFRLAVNSALAQVYRSGEIERLFSKWFGADASPTELLEGIFFLYGFSD